jgi:hypothetical protein
MLQDSHVTVSIFTLKKDFTVRGPRTRQAGRCSRSSARQEELPHNSRPFFTPRRTPTQIEALLHTKNSHTIRGPSSLQKDSQCARGPSSMNNPPTKRLMSQRTQERQYYGGRTTASPALLQLNCSCKHNIVAQSKSHF